MDWLQKSVSTPDVEVRTLRFYYTFKSILNSLIDSFDFELKYSFMKLSALVSVCEQVEFMQSVNRVQN